MTIRSLSSRLARIEAQRDNRRFQSGWDALCQEQGWPRIDVSAAQCIEDLLLGLQEDSLGRSRLQGLAPQATGP
jgi:hypothetical protein